MNIIDRLKNEQQLIIEAITQLKEVADTSLKKIHQLIEDLRIALSLHEIAEEDVLYSLLERKHKLLIFLAYEEHQRVDKNLEILRSTPIGDDKWLITLAEIKKTLQRHIEGRHKNIFTLAKEVFDEATLEKMGEQMEEVQETLKKEGITR